MTSIRPQSASNDVLDYRDHNQVGYAIHELAQQLFPICRSLTGPGNRQTLNILRQHLPQLECKSWPTGQQCFDWQIPDEWQVNEASITDESGNSIVDFKNNNLHLWGYSTPYEGWLTLQELQEHLYSIVELPHAIPYVTSYYEKRWGFSISHHQRKQLTDQRYFVRVDSQLKPGVMDYAELLIPGRSSKEVVFSTYICHPSMANNELSGPTLATYLAKYIATLTERELSYRFIFVPETIGSIAYISENLTRLQQQTIAGFVLTCVGDEAPYSYMPSRDGNTLTDRVIKSFLASTASHYQKYSYLERGSDERQYCAPGVDLPFASIMKSKYGEYPAYHTSLDDLRFVTAKGLGESFRAYRHCIQLLENHRPHKAVNHCEPQMGRRQLYPTLGTTQKRSQVKALMNYLAYADGKRDLLQLAEVLDTDAAGLIETQKILLEHQLITPL